jgi:hypothetical protein
VWWRESSRLIPTADATTAGLECCVSEQAVLQIFKLGYNVVSIVLGVTAFEKGTLGHSDKVASIKHQCLYQIFQ